MTDSDLFPVPHVSLRPQAARVVARWPGLVRAFRRRAQELRLQGRLEVADQLDEFTAQLRVVELFAQSHISEVGSAEVVDAEIGSELERPTSSDLDTATAGRLLGDIGPRRVCQLIEAGDLKARKSPSGVWMVDRDSVDELATVRRAP